MDYAAHLIIFISIFSIVVLGLNFITGYCGLLTLSHAAPFALGAYVYAIGTIVLGWPCPIGLGVAFIFGLIFGASSSLTAWRLKGDYFVLSTLAIQMLAFSVFQNWASPGARLGSFENMTNGSLGIAGVLRPEAFGVSLQSTEAFAMLAVPLVLVFGFMAWRLGHSPWARVLISLRDNELAASSIGKNIRVAKTQAVALGSAFGAVGGALYATYVGYLDPSSASLDMSILLLTMLIVGGSGNMIGPIVGAGILVTLPEALRSLHLPDALAGNVRLLLYGLLLVAIVHLRPSGISGEHRVR